MLGKGPRPIIGKLSELLVSGNRACFLDMATSPRGPLELKMESPRGLKNYDLGGVGLGIVANLEKSKDGGREILAKYVVGCSNLNRSSPIPVNSSKSGCNRYKVCEELEVGCEENYTYVTCHGQGKSFTKVLYEEDGYVRSGHERKDLERSNNKLSTVKDSRPRYEEDFSAYPTTYFLSCCQLCNKNLHGKDIYMYRYKYFLILFFVSLFSLA